MIFGRMRARTNRSGRQPLQWLSHARGGWGEVDVPTARTPNRHSANKHTYKLTMYLICTHAAPTKTRYSEGNEEKQQVFG